MTDNFLDIFILRNQNRERFVTVTPFKEWQYSFLEKSFFCQFWDKFEVIFTSK